MNLVIRLLVAAVLSAPLAAGAASWQAHIIAPDPLDHGPDGVTIRDFDADGLPDVLVPYEQGGYSRIYFHPGPGEASQQSRWTFIEFPFGGEDNGAGDLDQDGHVDAIVNGGHIYFNPGPADARSVDAWQRMSLFDRQARTPIIHDVDGDGHGDLLVDGTTVFRAPNSNKRQAAHYTQHTIGSTTWVMNTIPHDVDRDGDADLVIADRNGHGTIWLECPNASRLSPWKQHTLDAENRISFMKVADLDQDGRYDFLITDRTTQSIKILHRTNDRGIPECTPHRIPQVAGDFPKGLNVHDYNQDGSPEIFVLSKGQGEWLVGCATPTAPLDWIARPLDIRGDWSRLKMDDARHADLDGDGDVDVLTTDENGGWGTLWFENPKRRPEPQMPLNLPNPYRIQGLLHADDFDRDLSHWAVEQMPGGTTRLWHDTLEIEDAKGCTIWFRPKLQAPVLIEFDIKMIQAGGPYDRLSDLNSFTMAIDPEHPNDLFANSAKRGGRFPNYHGLRLYYVGYGANNNRTIRFRRYVGDGSRPVLPQHDLKGSHLPNQWRRVRILSTRDGYQYWIDEEQVYEVRDPAPYTSGWFGFRTVRNHMQIDRFRVWALAEK